jgi:hypothetical protein
MRRSLGILGVLLASGGAMTGGAGSAATQERIMPDAPFPIIKRQAEKQPRPLWRLPLGATRVDVMRPAGSGRLLVGLRKDEPALPNAEAGPEGSQ